ncbi:MAG: sigma-70 family RNA polymerase sigma factor [Flavobacteriaceae bacterium]|nr:sigma-70 family RNA polymerase sigma factor [Flavobacteriaceae bacterium]
MQESEDIKEYIAKAVLGNQKAFEYLLNEYWLDVFRFLKAKINNETEVEDLTIKSFSKAFDKIDTYNNIYIFKNWLFTIANNIFIDHYRKEKNKQAKTYTLDKNDQTINNITDNSLSPIDSLIQKQSIDELEKYMKLLKPNFRNVLRMRYFEEKTYKEISIELEETINNVKVRSLRAKKILLDIMSKNKDK